MNGRSPTIGIHGAPALEFLSRERQGRYLDEAARWRLVRASRRPHERGAPDGSARRRWWSPFARRPAGT